jgi:hypothetical protein
VSDTRQLALRLAALRVLMAEAKQLDDTARVEAKTLMAPKERASAVGPDGQLLGTVTMSSPNAKVTITDETALIGWLADRYPGHLDERLTITGPMDRAVEILAAYAPELVTRQPVLRDWARTELEELGKAAGCPVGPGGETEIPGIRVDTPPGTASVRLEHGAAHTIIDLFRTGRLALDGTLRALVAGETDAA